MKLNVSKETFTNQQGEVITYNAYVCRGVISGLPFQVYVKPYDLTGKQILKQDFEKGNVIIKDYVDKNGVPYSKGFFEVNGVSIPVIIEKEGIYIIKLYELLLQQSEKGSK